MKISLLAHGTRGDVQPILTLAEHLRADGHTVRIAAYDHDAAIVEGLGCELVRLSGGLREVYELPECREALRAGDGARFFEIASRSLIAQVGGLAARVPELMAGCDLALVHPMFDNLYVSIAEAAGVRLGYAWCAITWPNSTYPPRQFNYDERKNPRPGAFDRLNQVRASLGLRPAHESPAMLLRSARPPVFYWVSPKVLPPPEDLGDNHYFTGYWRPSAKLRALYGESQPSEALRDFLDSGPPPLFLSFGSVTAIDDAMVEQIGDIAREKRLRLLVGRGWSKLAAAGRDDVMVVGDIDHGWLLPRCAAAVCHGGASTVGAVLSAGIPMVAVSIAFDQALWGSRVAALGVGVTLPIAHLAAQLGGALDQVLSPPVRERARALGAQLAEEPDGAAVTARIISERWQEFPVPAKL